MTGSGTVGDPYIITTRADLEAIADDMTAYYELGGSISLSGADWLPIGWSDPYDIDTEPYFTGQLDGKGHAISGMTIRSSGARYYGGLFAWIMGATITNVHVCGAQAIVTLGAGEYFNGLGAVVGNVYGGTVTDCTGNLSVTCTGGDATSTILYVGGVVGGSATGTTVTRCRGNMKVTSNTSVLIREAGGVIGEAFGATVTDCVGICLPGAGSYDHVGGVAGLARDSAAFDGCEGTLTVTASSVSYVGGFTGQMDHSTTAVDCKATSTITCDGNYHGGFAGTIENSCSCERCVAFTAMSATSGVFHGGFAGRTVRFGDNDGGKTTNCYAFGTLHFVYEGVESQAVAGFVGQICSCSATITTNKCYAAVVLSGCTQNAVGGFYGGIDLGRVYNYPVDSYFDSDISGAARSDTTLGKSTAQMQTQSTFTNWDFSTVWNIASGTYPFLRTEFVVIADVCKKVSSNAVWYFGI